MVLFCSVLVALGFELHNIVCLICVTVFVTVLVCSLLSVLILCALFVLRYFASLLIVAVSHNECKKGQPHCE